MRLFFALFLYYVFFLPDAKAQETLPGFSASLKSNGKVLISWRNSYPSVNQISIQRSTDSLRNFTTLLTVPDPGIPENGFVDSKPGGAKMYYRIFILFPNSKYTFSRSRRAVTETAEPPFTVTRSELRSKQKTIVKTIPPIPNPVIQNQATKTQSSSKLPVQEPEKTAKETPPAFIKPPEEEIYLILPKIDNSRIVYMMDSSNLKRPAVTNPGKIKSPTIEVEKWLFVKRRDSVIMQLSANQVRRFSDSLLKKTRDTLYFVNVDTLQIKPYVEIYHEPKEVYKTSVYVFAVKDGNINISLPDYKTKKYSVSFFENDNTPVMEVKDIKDSLLIIDKTNFGHSGWFRFEIYEDGRLKEKNRLLIPKE